MKIKRRVYYSICNGQILNGNEFQDYEAILYGVYTPERATNYLRRKENNSITINNVEVYSEFRAMQIECFIEHSEVLSQRKEN